VVRQSSARAAGRSRNSRPSVPVYRAWSRKVFDRKRLPVAGSRFRLALFRRVPERLGPKLGPRQDPTPVAAIELSPQRLTGGRSTKLLFQFVITFPQKFDAEFRRADVINIYFKTPIRYLNIVLSNNL
jgi:hypothetical protein